MKLNTDSASKLTKTCSTKIILLYLVACAIILLIELACSFAVSTNESFNIKKKYDTLKKRKMKNRQPKPFCNQEKEIKPE